MCKFIFPLKPDITKLCSRNWSARSSFYQCTGLSGRRYPVSQKNINRLQVNHCKRKQTTEMCVARAIGLRLPFPGEKPYACARPRTINTRGPCQAQLTPKHDYSHQPVLTKAKANFIETSLEAYLKYQFSRTRKTQMIGSD